MVKGTAAFTMMIDGVTHYQLHWTPTPLPFSPDLESLNHWRTRFYDLGTIGQIPNRYGGAGFGNVSCRLHNNEFLISGTQTGHLRLLSLNHYSHVTACDVHTNNVNAKGPYAPSSEAMTHHMIYQCDPRAGFVIHLHAPTLWQKAASLGIPITPPEIGYGTPAMADAVAAIIAADAAHRSALTPAENANQQTINGAKHSIIAMGGHEDGIIARGATIDAVGEALVSLLSRAEEACTSDPDNVD